MESDEIAFVDPELNSNDDDPDGDKEPDGDMDPGTSVVITTSRSVIIEPVLAMFSASFLSCNTLISQLVYTIVAYQNNFTLVRIRLHMWLHGHRRSGLTRDEIIKKYFHSSNVNELLQFVQYLN
ncbi:hypothetical protein LSH36_181g02000 [Paralvinella palmiformis]|uniref:Uncharacterized protein n=1 Tax=Paralvinella palmiformis TaxID=53620 RepID=A0AAD9JS29_9ANNE|nr:hypothetical protein LSH36_181g02000 [Paralvinella palmiformis]